MTTRTAVYSCVTEGYDRVEETVLSSIGASDSDITYVLYSDLASNVTFYKNSKSEICWEIRPLAWKHASCPRRTARWHKINSHLLFPNYPYTIWIDAAQKIKKINLKTAIVEQIAPQAPLAAFKHPHRACIYEEFQACLAYKKDTPAVMADQIKQYKSENYPKNNRLVETGCVFRKYCSAITEFNNLWWKQINQYSVRDQLSFNYVAWKLKQPYAELPGSGTRSAFFTYVPHYRG